MLWLIVGPTWVYLLDFLHQYSVLFTIESLSLLYLLVITIIDLCVLGDDALISKGSFI